MAASSTIPFAALEANSGSVAVDGVSPAVATAEEPPADAWANCRDWRLGVRSSVAESWGIGDEADIQTKARKRREGYMIA